MYKNLRSALALVMAAAAAAPVASHAADTPALACFVYVSPVGQAGWTFQHDLARRAVERALAGRVATKFVEAVDEGPDAERVMRGFAREGCRIVFATSFGYQDGALRVAADHPGVVFEHAGGYKAAPNFATYAARFYEARWLAGYLAGRSSKTGVAGYVAGFPLPEVIQGINAFALGMQAANPAAVVRVTWLNTWFDPPREHDAAAALVAGGADVLANHSGSTAVPQLAEAKGVRVIGYPSDMARFAPHAQLAAVTADWSPYFIERTRAALDGRWRPGSTWGGTKDGMVALAALHPALPSELVGELQARRDALVAGRLKPFGGRLVDQAGRVRLAAGELDDRAIATMDWFVQGVTGTLPGR